MRINANKQRHEYENYTQLSKNIVRFKYKTATPSLRWRLASSMSTRRLRLIYLRRHQSKVERHTNTANREYTAEERSTSLPYLQLEKTRRERSRSFKPPWKREWLQQRKLPSVLPRTVCVSEPMPQSPSRPRL
ncbi:hypothetical protein B0I35DRAFT_253266 [Stachybotrys elegans]|uniref:Uncharacterized protein n=1 Tax=Stachybotrys elegans TaxID=80388 RepID=A0A8K0SCL8_9HYPO|nr:hypothetical protein B0I35DRAFT_253266 [Stachybotrys elegans]